jgi:hypothetical protein
MGAYEDRRRFADNLLRDGETFLRLEEDEFRFGEKLLRDSERFLRLSETFLRGCENVPSVPESLLVREENFLDDSNCFRDDLDNSQSRTESNFRRPGWTFCLEYTGTDRKRIDPMRILKNTACSTYQHPQI